MNHLVVAVAQSRAALFTSTAASTSSDRQKQQTINHRSTFRIPILPVSKPAVPVFIAPPPTNSTPTTALQSSSSASTTDKQTLLAHPPPKPQTNPGTKPSRDTPTIISATATPVDNTGSTNATVIYSLDALQQPPSSASSSSSSQYESTGNKNNPTYSLSESLDTHSGTTHSVSQPLPSNHNNTDNQTRHDDTINPSSPQPTPTTTTFDPNMSNPNAIQPPQPPSSQEEKLTNLTHSPSAGTPGRKPSKASQLRKSVVDPWKQKYDELKVKSTETTDRKYLPEDYVIQTVKHYFPAKSSEDAQIFVRLRKLFQLATLKFPKKPTPEQYGWIVDMKDYLIQATQNLTNLEYATDVERDKCNGWNLLVDNDNISLSSSSSSSLRKKRRPSSTDDDDDTEHDHHVDIHADKHTNTNVIDTGEANILKKKARRSESHVTDIQQECSSVAEKLNKKFARLKNKNSNYTFTDFWTQIGVKFQTNDAEYARARRLMNLELQPGVQLFYKTNKDLIQAFLNDHNFTPTSERRRSLSDLPLSIQDNSNTTATKKTILTPQEEDQNDNSNTIYTSFSSQFIHTDPTMNVINQFHSRIQAVRKDIWAKEKEIEENTTKLEQLTQQLTRTKQELVQLRKVSTELESKWEKVQRTLSDLMMD